ncbi:hypothetical protein [Streptomyces sp. NBRC 109706]|uniref:hypothetical protein n=1 Tax=Streptomyces sp. NBRC 109706 TaxID=1550035 RepID=UPI000A4AB3CC|nr:hypothetical protein [Streptomyces sp. NBRC 109706]
MPWVRLDDRFPSHRKVALLSDRAFRLYVSGLCWCSENLTEGRIATRELNLISRVRGAKTAAAELEKAGLWDRTDDGWEVHDYLEYNPDRARVKADREANAARQKAWRERKKAEREAKRAAEEAARNGESNAPRNGVTDDGSGVENDGSATRTRHDGDTNANGSDPENRPSSQVDEFRNGVNNAAPSPSRPSSPSTKEKKKQAGTQDGPLVPDFARDLVDQLTAAGMVVGWRLSEVEWFKIHAHIKRSSIPALVEFTRRRWNPADPPRSARYLTRIWEDMPSVPAGTPGAPALPAAATGTTGGSHNSSVIARFRARAQEQ